MRPPLCPHFEAAVLLVANTVLPRGWDVSDDVPTHPTLDWLNGMVASTGRITVWSGGSDQTIFADPATNYAFRAWHDWCHWRGQHDFDLEGEKAVAAMQKRHLRVCFPGNAMLPYWMDILDAEIVGQNEYALLTGEFPRDQLQFVTDYIAASQALRAAA